MNDKDKIKEAFQKQLSLFAKTLNESISTNNEWNIKGFIDVFENIYSISTDSKIVSKILEIHLFPQFLDFAEKNNYTLILPKHQNWYPDISLISKENEQIKFAIDLKTTYVDNKNPEYCNGFTLGSHGAYFVDRQKSKNIQFPYNEYIGHYCLGIIYNRSSLNEENKIYSLNDLKNIHSVINNFTFFATEKWKIASDKSGSGNTANIGSIKKISDILEENGAFKNLGEEWFDDYWMNYGKINFKNSQGQTIKITNLSDFLKFRGKDEKLANLTTKKIKKGGKNEN